MADYSISAKISADTQPFAKGINTAKNSLKNFNADIKQATKLIGGMFAVGSIASLGKSLSVMSKDFAKATSAIAKGTGAIGDDLDSLSNSVKDSLINGVGQSAETIGKMIADLNTRFGATGKEVEVLVDDFDKFSSVTGVDAVNSITSVTNTLNKWGVELDRSSDLLDQLTVASQSSGASVESLLSGLQSGQTVLSSFGMNLTESIGFLSSLEKAGVDSATTLGGMKIALAKFSTEGKDAETEFNRIAEAIKNAETDTEALSIAVDTFGSRNGAEMVKVLKDGSTSMESFTEQLRNAGNALDITDEASRTSIDAFDDLKATIQGVFFSQQNDTVLKEIIDELAEAVRNIDAEKIAESFTKLKETIETVFTEVGSTVQTLWQYISDFFTDLKNYLSQNGVEFSSWEDTLSEILDGFSSFVQRTLQIIMALLEGDFSLAWEYTKLTIMQVIKELLESFDELSTQFKTIISGIISSVAGIATAIGVATANPILTAVGVAVEASNIAVTAITSNEKTMEKVTAKLENAITDSQEEIEKKTKESNNKIAKSHTQSAEKRKKTNATYVKKTKEQIKDLEKTVTKAEDKTTEKVTKSSNYLLDGLIEGLEEVGKEYKECETRQEMFGKVIENTAKQSVAIGTQAFGDMFSLIGQSLVSNSVGFEDMGAVALESIAQVLSALGSELIALSAVRVAHYDYGTAAAAATAASVAFVSAGVLTGISSQMKSSADETENASSELLNFTQNITYLGETLDELEEGSTNVSGFVSATIVKTSETINQALKNIAIAEDNLKRLQELWEENKEEIAKASDERNWIILLLVKQQEIEQSIARTKAEYEQLMNIGKTAFNELKSGISATNIALKNSISTLKEFYSSVSLYGQNSVQLKIDIQRSHIYEQYYSLLEDFENFGVNLSDKLIDGLKEGLSSSDFKAEIKDYIRENLLKLTIYDQYSYWLSSIGNNLSKALTSGITEASMQSIADSIDDIYNSASKQIEAIDDLLNKVFGVEETIEEELSGIAEQVQSVKDSLADLSASVGSTFLNAFTESLESSDIDQALKEYLKNLLYEAYLYSEEYISLFENIGSSISAVVEKGISGADISSDMARIKEQVNTVKDTFIPVFEEFNSVLDEVFGEGLDSAVDNATDSLSTLETKIESFKETIADLGGTLADELTNGLKNGLDMSDFLDSFKSYLRKMIVQSVVYTENMKSEIEAIGNTISKGLVEGFTGNALDELRRDISYLYYNADKSMGTIDNLLNSVFSGYATGTENATRGLHLVGEAGPELVKFRGGEKVYNASETRDIMGGNNFNVTFVNTQDTTAIQMMDQLRTYNREMAINGVI